MNYTKLNKITGWAIFGIATLVYLLTIESTASLWDCGEYITAAYKLEVGHPPGAPLFMILGRLFSIFASQENVAVWINALSALSSSFTILFMFWSLTLMLKKLTLMRKSALENGDKIMILASAAVGSLAYTFSDSFWFSAVEGEVYAMASLFTAVIFWAALKWDDEMRSQELALNQNVMPNRWLLIIFFLLGLAIGVHLLGILVVPAIGYIIYFNVAKQFKWTGFVLTGIISVLALGFIQEGIIPGTISLASSFEVGFVNGLGLPFFSGSIFFLVCLVLVCILGIRYSHRKKHTILYNVFMGVTLLLIGYGSFAVIVIRSNANTPLDENNPENLVTLHSYLKREQYGSSPILKGQYWNSYRLNERATENGPQLTSKDGWGDLSAFYLRRFVVEEGDRDVKAFELEKDAQNWVKKNKGSYTITEKYFESNASIRVGGVPAYEQTTLFPRMYAETEQHIAGYKSWSGYNADEDKGTELGRDGLRLPTTGENLTYFMRYQVDWMYIRYLMWNFSGRQNDIQGHGDNMRGNWISGFDFIDAPRVGSASDQPFYTTENPSNNTFFLLPLVFAVLGIFFHFYRSPKDAFVLLLAFLFTGLAIVVYLNQKPMEPRERDYAYSGSFYFFAMWISFGVYALYDIYQSFTKKDFIKLGYFAGGGLLVTLIFGFGILWLTICGIVILMIGLMLGLKKVSKKQDFAAILSTSLGLLIPLMMGVQGWDDHDRSGKTTARDLAYNYLNSCNKNGILFTNGDNDTFPLWYLQEVEGKRTDVRVCNLSLMGTDWYTNQMKLRAYESAPLPIKFKEDQVLMYAGNTDQIYFLSLLEMISLNSEPELIKKVIDMRTANNPVYANQAVRYFNAKLNGMRGSFTIEQPSMQESFDKLWVSMVSEDTSKISDNILAKYNGIFEILGSIKKGNIKLDENASSELQKLFDDFEKPWQSVDFQDAMAFVRDDKNYVVDNDGNHITFFPSTMFTFKVNKKNVLKSGVVKKANLKNCEDEITFAFNNEQDRYLTRDEIMMMDMVANNDWERGIYFSSNRGSAFSLALLSSGWVKQVGMAYVLSPIKDTQHVFYDLDEMYKNMTSVYEYGDMSNPSVLTDYYARRHTSQYRVNFLLLAEQFYLAKDYSKANKLLDLSLKVMPLENVMDFGEVNICDPMNMLTYNGRNKSYMYGEQEVRAKNSGCLHEYVQLYYLLHANAKGEKLGNNLLNQYESILKFFKNTDAEIAADMENTEDLLATTDALCRMYSTLQDPSVKGENSAFGKRIKKNLDLVYKVILPRLSNQLSTYANDNGEIVTSNSGRYGKMYLSLNQNLTAIGEHYRYLKTSMPPAPTEPTNLPAQSPTTPLMPGNGFE
jgi:hypothetical protein